MERRAYPSDPSDAEYAPSSGDHGGYATFTDGLKLTEAGVPTTSVPYNGILHDFMMLNPIRRTGAATAAIAQAIDVLKTALGAAKVTA